jgi:hypothetical protein
LRIAVTGAHPAPGEEVMAMDDVDVDVDVTSMPIDRTSITKERVSNYG